MFTMQAFHAALFSPPGKRSEYFRILAQLTRINLNTIRALKSELAWDIWR